MWRFPGPSIEGPAEEPAAALDEVPGRAPPRATGREGPASFGDPA